ncbi:MAG: hypothetical protein KF909_08745 [Rhodocyclaceae bacterium]|nr:hypothetical protein [Rhodocyclaceae bacterium]MCP5238728.1 hypothetical protein [Zoogloeaceae bacterium]
MKLPAHSLARLLLIVLSALLSACASTRFSSEAPTSPGQPGQKLLVMVSTADDTLRRITENQLLADILPADNASAAHRLGIDGQPADPATRERMSAAGFDRVLLLRIAGIEKRTIQYPPTPYFYGDPWMWGWPHAWRPFHPFGYAPLMPPDASQPRLVEALAVSVESQLLSLPDGVLLWRGLSHTLTEGSSTQALEDIAATVIRRLGERNWLHRK